MPEFNQRLTDVAPSAVILVGMEAHVCVYQTVRDLVARGIEVHVPVDGVVSRHEDHRATGVSLCERAGAMPTTTETIVFDWLGRAGTDAFRAISKLVNVLMQWTPRPAVRAILSAPRAQDELPARQDCGDGRMRARVTLGTRYADYRSREEIPRMLSVAF